MPTPSKCVATFEQPVDPRTVHDAMTALNTIVGIVAVDVEEMDGMVSKVTVHTDDVIGGDDETAMDGAFAVLGGVAT